jgi:hypothetical protein
MSCGSSNYFSSPSTRAIIEWSSLVNNRTLASRVDARTVPAVRAGLPIGVGIRTHKVAGCEVVASPAGASGRTCSAAEQNISGRARKLTGASPKSGFVDLLKSTYLK